MDVAISADGNTLYISRVRHTLFTKMLGQPPKEMRLLVAHRTGEDSFSLGPESAETMRAVNTENFEYAAAVSSDKRELYFNRGLRIMVATRGATNQPFGPPRLLAACTGYVEAAAPSPDKSELFFHKKAGDRFVVYRALRNPQGV
jgi:hypothetical protein